MTKLEKITVFDNYAIKKIHFEALVLYENPPFKQISRKIIKCILTPMIIRKYGDADNNIIPLKLNDINCRVPNFKPGIGNCNKFYYDKIGITC